jgi:hypothetical protein
MTNTLAIHRQQASICTGDIICLGVHFPGNRILSQWKGRRMYYIMDKHHLQPSYPGKNHNHLTLNHPSYHIKVWHWIVEDMKLWEGQEQKLTRSKSCETHFPYWFTVHTAWGQMGKGWEIIRNGLAFTYDHKLLGIFRLNENIFFFPILKIF